MITGIFLGYGPTFGNFPRQMHMNSYSMQKGCHLCDDSLSILTKLLQLALRVAKFITVS